MKTFGNYAVLVMLSGFVLLAGCKTASAPTPTPKPVPVAAVKVAQVASTTPEPVLENAAAKPSPEFAGTGWKSLYDGKTLAGWQLTDFAGSGPTECESGLIVIEIGDALSGINYTNGGLPKMNYEVALDAMKLKGSDFFCGLTFPVRDSFCSLIIGGWGGAVTGLSSIDDEDASENETAKFLRYELNRWYRIRVRVTEKKIEAWLDNDKVVDLITKDRKIGLRFGEIESSVPLGISTYQTRAAIRQIKIRSLDDGEK